MKKFASWILFLFFCINLSAQTNYQSMFAELLKDDFLKTSEVGIAVYDLSADSLLYSYQSNKRYRPASVEKLITTVTAASLLGGEHRFDTSLATTGTIYKDTLRGDLYVIGGFDPDCMMDQMNQLVKQLVAKHIKNITGKVYTDVSMIDSTLYWGAGWSWDDALYDFQPVLSPLMFHKGWVTVTAYPTDKGNPAKINIYPGSSYHSVINNTVTYGKNKFAVIRDAPHYAKQIMVSGGVSSRLVKTITVEDSKTFFIQTLLDHLRKEGVDSLAYGGNKETPIYADTIFKVGHSLAEVTRRALKVSDNLNAEAIFYHLAAYQNQGKYATDADAKKCISNFISKIGEDPDNYLIADGCGVSLYDYISPDLLIDFLKYAYRNKSVYDIIYPALPIAGVDGTLRNRMKNGNTRGNVHAKTGTVTGVSSLAGYLQTINGHQLAFVIINQNILGDRKAHAFQDRACRMLAQ